MRVYLTNLGCKLNQAEMEELARRVGSDGHEIVSSLEAADLHIVNTCTVTHAAARSSRKTARRSARRGAAARTVLTGCFVDGSTDEAARLAGVDLVVPNRHKENLLELVYERFPDWRPLPATVPPVPYVPLDFGNSRALMKIEDGCNMSCSFCIIPLTRGRQRSRAAQSIVEEATDLAHAGFREIVITGVQISSYRWRDTRLATLIRRLVDETPVERFRLTSIAPWDFDLRLLDLVDTGRICQHFHLSLQSGSDATLRRMRRPYEARGFAALVGTIRRRFPDCAITTDVIVGFPGESESDFQDSLDFVEAMRFAKLHAFPYSPRPGTIAAEMGERVAPEIQRHRMNRLLDVATQAEKQFRARQLGRTLAVLWERSRDGVWQGTSDNYVKVSSTHKEELRLALTPTLIEALTEDAVQGRPLLAA